MLILSRVCADFFDRAGNLIFSVHAANRNTFLEAPDRIAEDPLFRMLLNEGSLEANLTAVERRRVENDPANGTDASGKKAAAENADPADSPEPVRPAASDRRSRTLRAAEAESV